MSTNKPIIRILLTGGTIDKHYNQSNGDMEFSDSHIEDILQQGRNRANLVIDQILFKDSLDITPQERETIAQQCQSSPQDKILITHGTDTMVETATHIAQQYPHLCDEKCIVLVGSMIPFEISYSDATFNLGFALGALNSLSNGIYLAMNGKVFSWDSVRKNLELGEFKSI